MSKKRFRKTLPPGEGTVFDSAQYPRTLTIAPAGDDQVLFEIDENPRFLDAPAALVQFPAAQVPLIMSAMVACTGKYPTELTRIAHQKGLLGRPAVETRQSRRAAARHPAEKMVSEYNYKLGKKKPEIPEAGYFEFTDAYGDVLKVEPYTEGGAWRIVLTIISKTATVSAQFKALDVIPLFVAAGTHTGRDSRSLGEEAVAAGYMSNRQVPLSRAQRRKAGKKPAAPAVAATLGGDLRAVRELDPQRPKLTTTVLGPGRPPLGRGLAPAPGSAFVKPAP